jgi:hypothetical protein
VDLAAAPGSTVLAAGSGVVAFAGVLAGRGVLSIVHANGLRTTYEPLQPTVAVGARVAAGAVVGRLAAGHPGCPEPSCLHFGLRRGAEYLDPLDLFRHGPIRLLPLAEAADAAPARPGQVVPAAADSGPVAPAARQGAAADEQPPPATAEPATAGQPAAGPAQRRTHLGSASIRLASSAGLAIALALLIIRRRPP